MSYFPPTPAADDVVPVSLPNGQAKPSAQNNMASLLSNTTANGSAKRGTSPGRTGPHKVTLSLGHLPSKKEVKGTYPRTPSRVCGAN